MVVLVVWTARRDSGFSERLQVLAGSTEARGLKVPLAKRTALTIEHFPKTRLAVNDVRERSTTGHRVYGTPSSGET
jgi:hypothetical protein